MALSIWTALALLAAATPSPAAASETIVVADSTQPAPDGNGSFLSFGVPVVNDVGQSAFFAQLTGTSGGSTDNEGLFLGAGGTVTTIAREGEAAPPGGTFQSLASPVVNDGGEVAFFANLRGSGAGPDSGLFRGDGTSLVAIVLEGDPAPGGNGDVSTFFPPDLNSLDQVAFHGVLVGTSGGASDDRALYRGDGGPLVEIAREGSPVPGGNVLASLQDALAPVINDAGEVGFFALVGGGVGEIVARGDGASLVPIAREGQPAPGGGTFSGFFGGSPSINDPGELAFLAFRSGGPDGIFRGDGTTLVEVVRVGEPAPRRGGGTDGTFSSLDAPDLNDLGQTLFTAVLNGTSGGSSANSGLYRSDGTSAVEIVREGDPAPDGNGIFSGKSPYVLADAGQVAFEASFFFSSGGFADDRGIYFFDDGLGLVTVAREGDPFLGSTIVALTLNGFTQVPNGDGLGADSHVSYRFELADGVSGIALWHPTGRDRGDRFAPAPTAAPRPVQRRL